MSTNYGNRDSRKESDQIAKRSKHQLTGHSKPELEGKMHHQKIDDQQWLLKETLGDSPMFQAVSLGGSKTMGEPDSAGHMIQTSECILVSSEGKTQGFIAALYDDDARTLTRYVNILAQPFPHWLHLQEIPKKELISGTEHHPSLSGYVKIPSQLETDADLVAVAKNPEELFLMGTVLLNHGQIRGPENRENWKNAALYSLWALDVWRCFQAVKADHLAKIQAAQPEVQATLITTARE